MKAVIYRRHGTPVVLELAELPTPSPARGEALVKVHATSINPKDVLLRKGRMTILGPQGWPKTTGHDFAGTIESIGEGATGYHPGDRVYGHWNGRQMACAAEYAAFPTDAIAPMPKKLSFAEAAGVPLAGQTALQALRDLGGVGPGSRVLINGASGGVGCFAVGIAKTLGATVTTLTSARNHALMRELGADACWDYQDSGWRRSEERFDVFFDVFGNQSLAKVRQLLTSSGRYITTIPSPRSLLHHALTRFSPGRRDLLILVRSRSADLRQMAEWIDAGTLRVVIDRTWPLAQIAEAHAYLETKRARGKVVLTLP